MGAWKPLKNADGKGGVRYREHPTRKHGAVPDRYYVITYWWQGKSVSEGIGWASEKWTPSKCFDLLAEIKNNQGIGKGPCTLSEMRKQAEIEKEAEQKRLIAAEIQNISFKIFFDDVFLPDAKTRWKPETTRKAEEHIKNWIDPVTGRTPLKEIGLIHANRIKAKMSGAQKSPRTIQYVFRTFAMVWKAAIDHGIVSTPCPTKSGSFRLPKVDNERQRYLSIEEEKKLLAEIRKKSQIVHDMAVVSLDAGLRFSEVANLTWDCVDLKNALLMILDTKGGRDRNVPMTERLKGLFKSKKGGLNNELIFPSKSEKNNKDQGEETVPKVMRQIPSTFVRAMKDSGLNNNVTNRKMKASFHTLRHTCASRMVQAGVDLYRVQRLLGHSTPVMTARYSKLADDDLRQAIRSMEQNGVTPK